MQKHYIVSGQYWLKNLSRIIKIRLTTTSLTEAKKAESGPLEHHKVHLVDGSNKDVVSHTVNMI